MTQLTDGSAEIPQQQRSEKRRQHALNKSDTHRCPSCGEAVYCGFSAGDNTCWCFDVERHRPLPAKSENKLCLCPQCLAKNAGQD
jgi:acetyl-CoA carboxylase beta subunit